MDEGGATRRRTGSLTEAGPTVQMGAASAEVISGNRYRIEKLLGRGGMGEVWKAFDLKLQVEVALKFLRPEVFKDAQGAEFLRGEVRAARDVASPHVCRIFDLVEVDGQELVSMEYIDGLSLGQILESRGPLELREATEIAAQLMAGLDAIHEAGLVHCDLKPENVMVTRSGRVVVMDFGIARAGPKPGAEGAGGAIAGTPAYMSPEQMRGEDLDGTSDLFAAGIVLAEMLMAEGESVAERKKKVLRGVRETPPRLPEGPWQSVLTRAVAPDRLDRFGTATELVRALEEASSRAVGDEGRTPYPGLESFTESDAEYFFGREIEVERIWKKLDRFSMLGVIGPSGVGKSSFLRAGLFPAAPEGWRCVFCTPGRSPFIALAQSLVADFSGQTEAIRDLMGLGDVDTAIPILSEWRKHHEHVLLVFDQFEELFTLNPPEVQAMFAELLGRLAVEADIHVLVSMRDDFFFHCHEYEPLLPLFPGAVPLGPLTGADLRRALVQPALACGYRFEDETLIKEMLHEVSDERGALPLLAFAAARLWEKRDRTQGLLTRTAYEEAGRVGGALARHAEATLERIGSEHLDTVREMFRNLITAEGTRVARTRKELLSVFENPEVVETILQQLIDARLLTSYEEHVDVARLEEKVGKVAGIHRIEIVHESLLKSWPRLVRWQAQDAEGALLRDQLRQAAQVWEERDRSSDLLWAGTAFQEFELWRARYPGGLTDAEEDYAKAMIKRDRRNRRRRRIALVTVFAVLSVVLVVVGISRQQAVEQARRAEASQLIMLGQQQLEENNSMSLAYAIASLEMKDTPQARLFALEALWKGPTNFFYPGGPEGGWVVDFSPDGRWLAEAADDVILWSEDGGEPTALSGHKSFTQTASFHPEKSWLVSCSQDTPITVRIWSAPEGELVHALEFDGLTNANWGRGGKALITATEEDDQSVLWRSWSLEDWAPTVLGTAGKAYGWLPRRTDPQGTHLMNPAGNEFRLISLDQLESDPEGILVGRLEKDVVRLAIDPAGKQIASLDEDREIRLWALDGSYQESSRLIGRHDSAFGLRFGPSGEMLASNGDDGKARVWNLTGPPEAEGLVLRKPGNQVNDVAFHPSGEWIAVAGAGQLRLWPLAREYPIVLNGHTGPVFGLVFDPEGKWLASASSDLVVRVWSLSPDASVPAWSRALETGPYGMNVGEMGDKLIVCGPLPVGVTLMSSTDGETRVMDICTDQDVMLSGAISADGRYAAASGSWGTKGQICIWELETGRSWMIDAGHGSSVGDLDFTADGKLLESSGGGLRLWNIEERTYELLIEEAVANADVSRDGQRIVIAARAGVIIHDRRTGESKKLEVYPYQNLCAIDPSGEWIVTSYGASGEIRFGSVKGEEPHLLLRHDEIYSLDFDPLGRWIASGARDGSIRLWPIPSGQSIHRLPYEEFMEKLRSLTNIRMIKDEESETGWDWDISGVPGWAEAPTW